MSQVNAKTLMLGQNADQSKNFKISVPMTEDGTMTIERADGTDVMKFLAAGEVEMPTLPFSKTANGYMTLPNGFIVQWGSVNVTTTAANTTKSAAPAFPIPFPNAVLATWCSAHMPVLTQQILHATPAAPTLTNMSFQAISSVTGLTFPVQWLAIGY